MNSHSSCSLLSRRFSSRAAALFLLMTATGCAITAEEAPVTTTAIPLSQRTPTLIAQGQVAALPTQPKPVKPEKPAHLRVIKDEKTFNYNVRGAPVRAALQSLVHGTPYSLVLDPGIKGRISINLKQVTVTEAIQVVCQIKNYDCQRMRTGFMIFPKQVTNRVFHVNYPDMIRTGASSTRVSSGRVDESSSTSTSSEGTTTSQQADGSTGAELNTTFSSNFWREMTTMLCATLGLPAPGSGSTATDSTLGSTVATGASTGNNLTCQTVTTNKKTPLKQVSVSSQTGLISVRAYPKELLQVEALLQSMQTNLVRQVILEAKIVEVTLNDGYRNGINWSILSEPGSGTFTTEQTGGGSLLSDEDSPSDLINSITELSNGTPVSAFGGMFAIRALMKDFNLFLEMLKTQGEVHVLSSPRIATLNNQKAVIKVGEDDYFVTDIDVSISDGNVLVSPTFTPFFSGVALDVVPQIGRNGQLTMHIHPSVSVIREKVKRVDNREYPLAHSSVRESDSLVRAVSGEIVVIGGLMKEEEQQELARTPILSDLPGVGSLFKQKKEYSSKSELVILIRPTIVPLSDTWKNIKIPVPQVATGLLGTL